MKTATEVHVIDWRKHESQQPLLAALDESLALLRKINGSTLLEQWWSKVVFALVQTVKFAYSNLIAGARREEISYCAWCARTLAEAEIWLEYVTLSRESARRFHDDWVNDISDAMRCSIPHEELTPEALAALKLIYGEALVSSDYVNRAKEKLAEFKASTETEDEAYLRISSVAKQVNKGAWFANYNKMLSKYVHVTAQSALSFPTEKHRSNLSHFLLYNGSLSCVRAISLVNDFFKKQGFPPLF